MWYRRALAVFTLSAALMATIGGARADDKKYHNWKGKEFYLLSWDGYLMPIKKGQSPPDTRYFPPAQK